ncbi:MAG: DUF4910 domain-containing protein [Bacteroidales bacterium]|nr:MAG: DUF4910 domain-containing protein [Bacteroidales bacterium]
MIRLIAVIISVALIPGVNLYPQNLAIEKNREMILETMHSISSHTLMEYVEELVSDKYAGRLTGTEEYDEAANWLANQFREANIRALGDNQSYFQKFDIPYTLVFRECFVSLHIPVNGDTILKNYEYVKEFIPGSTSGSGEITAEVIYAGYGITAPELDYDDYKGIDVKGKILVLEREAPVSDRNNPELFKKWRPYSFHQYKLDNAVKHGAKGMLYNYGPIGNPNNSYHPGFIYSHIGDSVISDLFSGTGKLHREVVTAIQEKLQPQSFRTGKTVTIKNTTEHHPDGKGSNVIGWIGGNDPELKKETVMIGAHLDHLGACYEIMPGANDNASGVAVMLGIAKALAMLEMPLKRSIVFIAFGAEEQSIIGSKFYLENPAFPTDKTVCMLNLDGVGNGTKLTAIAGKNYTEIWNVVEWANNEYIHRSIRPTDFPNLARPRLDAARFMWAGIPSISFSAYGTRSAYHVPQDNIDLITPEIMEDLAQMLFLAVIEMANRE